MEFLCCNLGCKKFVCEYLKQLHKFVFLPLVFLTSVLFDRPSQSQDSRQDEMEFFKVCFLERCFPEKTFSRRNDEIRMKIYKDVIALDIKNVQ